MAVDTGTPVYQILAPEQFIFWAGEDHIRWKARFEKLKQGSGLKNKLEEEQINSPASCGATG